MDDNPDFLILSNKINELVNDHIHSEYETNDWANELSEAQTAIIRSLSLLVSYGAHGMPDDKKQAFCGVISEIVKDSLNHVVMKGNKD